MPSVCASFATTQDCITCFCWQYKTYVTHLAVAGAFTNASVNGNASAALRTFMDSYMPCNNVFGSQFTAAGFNTGQNRCGVACEYRYRHTINRNSVLESCQTAPGSYSE
ncbi:hypothetical protein HaLaN_16158, partial [Haematococcus lacustris]